MVSDRLYPGSIRCKKYEVQLFDKNEDHPTVQKNLWPLLIKCVIMLDTFSSLKGNQRSFLF